MARRRGQVDFRSLTPTRASSTGGSLVVQGKADVE
jgi:hypothetical protein